MARGFLDEARPEDDALDSGAVAAVEIAGRLTGERTAKAFAFNDGVRTIWVPFSLLLGQEQRSRRDVTISIPEWFAKQNNLI